MSDWNNDAEHLHDLSSASIAENTRIKDFLHPRSQKFLIVASKGMGKTLLLRHKRLSLDKSTPGAVLIPQNVGWADFVTLPPSMPEDLLTLMDRSEFWRDLWILAIGVSVLLHFPSFQNLSEEELDAASSDIDRSDLPQTIADELRKALRSRKTTRRKPSEVLNILLQTTRQSARRGVEKMRSNALAIIRTMASKFITSACYVFIDGFDQELNNFFQDEPAIWCNAQCGLIKAAWEISRQSAHVRIYATIRQEAWSYFKDPEKANIRGSTLIIEYSKEDLRKIFDNAIKQYERVETLEEFVGVKEIYNGHLNMREPIFDYICRHTIGVPRWLMVIGEKLSQSRPDRGLIKLPKQAKVQQQNIAEVVTRVSSDTLVVPYLTEEMKAFFRHDSPQRFLDELIAKIGSTALSTAGISRLAENFRASSPEGLQHPFCLMFNLGLLGYVEKALIGAGWVQKFKKPYEFDWAYDDVLPKNHGAKYLIHPALHNFIRSKNSRFKYSRVRIGDTLPWKASDEEKFYKERIRIFIAFAEADREVAEQVISVIENRLIQRGIVHDIWINRWNQRDRLWEQVQSADPFKNSDYLVLLLSNKALEEASLIGTWKAAYFHQRSKRVSGVFPLLLDNSEIEKLPKYLESVYAYRYENDPVKLERLVDDALDWSDEDRVN